MSKLSRTESAQLMSLMDKPGWACLTKLVAMTINELNAREATGENEFQVLRALFTRQGRVGGLTEFFNGIENGESLSGEMK